MTGLDVVALGVGIAIFVTLGGVHLGTHKTMSCNQTQRFSICKPRRLEGVYDLR